MCLKISLLRAESLLLTRLYRVSAGGAIASCSFSRWVIVIIMIVLVGAGAGIELLAAAQ